MIWAIITLGTKKSTLVECKNEPTRTERVINILTSQVKTCTSEKVIKSTIEKVKTFGLDLKAPELFVIVAPPKSDVYDIFNGLKESRVPVSFINTDSIGQLGKFLSEGNNIEGLKILKVIEPFQNSSRVIVDFIN